MKYEEFALPDYSTNLMHVLSLTGASTGSSETEVLIINTFTANRIVKACMQTNPCSFHIQFAQVKTES